MKEVTKFYQFKTSFPLHPHILTLYRYKLTVPPVVADTLFGRPFAGVDVSDNDYGIQLRSRNSSIKIVIRHRLIEIVGFFYCNEIQVNYDRKFQIQS